MTFAKDRRGTARADQKQPSEAGRPRSSIPAIDEELAFHFAATVEKLIDDGLEPKEAHRLAMRRFGDLEHVAKLERLHRKALLQRKKNLRVREVLDVLTGAFRRAVRTPALALSVVLLMGCGLGATAITFGLFDRLLLQPPVGVVAPELIEQIGVERDFRGRRVVNSVVSFPDSLDFVGARSVERAAVYAGGRATLGRGSSARSVRIAGVSSDFFQLLGANAAAGRLLLARDSDPGEEPVAVISYELRRELFSAVEPIGQTLDLAIGTVTVVGVAPRGFSGVRVHKTDVWLPLHHAASMMVSDNWATERGVAWLHGIVRRTPSASQEAVAAELTALHRAGRANSSRPDYNPTVVLTPLRSTGATTGRARVASLAALVSLMLLTLVSLNVANLLLAHSLHRRTDLSVQLSLGISRARLVGEQVAFALLLTAVGGLLAVAVAHWGGQAAREILLSDIAFGQSVTAPRTLVMILLGVLVSGAIAAVLPALEARRLDLGRHLGAARGRLERTTMRRVLLATQVALSALFLVGAGLFARSYERAAGVDLGFDTRGLTILTLEPVLGTSPTDRERDVTRTFEWLGAESGLHQVAAAAVAPFYSSWSVPFRVAGLDELPESPEGGPYIYPVSPGFFETMGLDVLRGRGIGPTDREGSALVAVVNQTMADRYWPDGDALGQCLLINRAETTCTEVVGVVEDAHRQSILEAEQFLYYVPIAQKVVQTNTSPTFYYRAGERTGPTAERLQRDLVERLSSTRTVRLRQFEDLVSPQLETWRLGATLLGAFGVLALVVTGAGIYSLLSFEVARRRREIGVRAALGATGRAIVSFVARQGMLPVVGGAAAGLLLARALSPLLEQQLFSTATGDPATFVATSILLLLSASVAILVPVFRALRLNPSENLRSD